VRLQIIEAIDFDQEPNTEKRSHNRTRHLLINQKQYKFRRPVKILLDNPMKANELILGTSIYFYSIGALFLFETGFPRGIKSIEF